jgi:DNA repair exonuclease SbcCD nuclease subunit
MKLINKKIAIVSDLHAGVHQNSHMWGDILLNWAEWFANECEKREITDIVIPGDIFHHRNEINVYTLHNVYNAFQKLKNFNILALVGNHDAYYKNNSKVHSISLLNEWGNIEIADKVTTFKSFGKQITLCPWGVQLEEIPESDIIFGHFELQGFNMSKYQICDHGFSSKDILSKAPLIITGHFHLRDERIYDNGKILYVGSAYQMDWGDTETTRGFYTLDLEDNEIEFIENPVSPKHFKFKLSEILDRDTFKTIKPRFKNNIIKIILDKKIQQSKIEKLLLKLGSLNALSLQTDYENVTSVIKDDLEFEFTGIDIDQCIQEYVELLEIDNKKEIVNYLIDLYKQVT